MPPGSELEHATEAVGFLSVANKVQCKVESTASSKGHHSNLCCDYHSIVSGSAISGPKMQLWNDGTDQGAGVTAKYIGWNNLERPNTQAFDGTWVRL